MTLSSPHAAPLLLSTVLLVAACGGPQAPDDPAAASQQRLIDPGKEDEARAARQRALERISPAEELALRQEGLPLYAVRAVAFVDGRPVTAAAFNQQARKLIQMADRLPPKTLLRQRKLLVDRLVDQSLIEAQMDRAKIPPPGAQEVQRELEAFIDRYPNRQAYEGFLRWTGVDEAQLQEELRRSLRLQAYLEQEEGVRVTEEEVRRHYQKDKHRYHQPEEVRAGHILLKLDRDADAATIARRKAEAVAIVKEARKPGADFDALARQRSEGPTASRGGELGFFTRERMVPPFSRAAFSMKPGEVSDPVRTKFGWHVIKVYERKDKRTQTFDEVRGQIHEQLERREQREAVEKLLERLKRKAEIERIEGAVIVAGDHLEPTTQPTR